MNRQEERSGGETLVEFCLMVFLSEGLGTDRNMYCNSYFKHV